MNRHQNKSTVNLLIPPKDVIGSGIKPDPILLILK